MPKHDNILYTLSDVANIIQGTGGFTEELVNSILVKYKTLQELKGKWILEAGCGCGKLGMFFENFGMNYMGIDIDVEQLRYAEKLKKICQILYNRPITAGFFNQSVHKLDAKDNSFNFVFSEGVIEHWTGKKRQNVVNEMSRVAKDAVMIFVPSAEHPESRKIARECEHIFKGMGKREYPLTCNDLAMNLYNAGLKDITVHPCNKDIPIARRMIFGVGYK